MNIAVRTQQKTLSLDEMADTPIYWPIVIDLLLSGQVPESRIVELLLYRPELAQKLKPRSRA